MAFDVVWAPGQTGDPAKDAAILQAWHDPLPAESEPTAAEAQASAEQAAPDAAPDPTGAPDAQATGAKAPEAATPDVTADATGPDAPKTDDSDQPPAPAGPDMSGTALYRAMLDELMSGHGAEVAATYGFSISPVTDERPYLAGYIKPADIWRALGHFDAISEDWGFLLLWVSLGQSLVVGAVLILLPVLFGWRTIFARQPGKLGLMGYFACLGLGYILVEVTLIAKFVRVLGNPTVSASAMLTGMLVLSGLGALASTRPPGELPAHAAADPGGGVAAAGRLCRLP